MSTTTTSNYGWTIPNDSELVKDGAAAIRTLGNAADSSLKSVSDASVAKSLIDAKGDLLVGTAADTIARLGVGTDGQVLTADAASTGGVKWGSPAAGGMTLLANGSLSGSSVSINSIPTGYISLYLEISNLAIADLIVFRLNNDTGNNYSRTRLNGSTLAQWGAEDRFYGEANSGTVIVQILNYASTTSAKPITLNHYATAGNSAFYWEVGGWANNSTAVSSIQMFGYSASFTAGTYKLYGVK